MCKIIHELVKIYMMEESNSNGVLSGMNFKILLELKGTVNFLKWLALDVLSMANPVIPFLAHSKLATQSL
jgi:hypothetical protein